MPRWILFTPLALFLVLSLIFYKGLFLEKEILPSALLDKPFPNFALTRLSDGADISALSLPKVVFLSNIWATWCASCRTEHPVLMEIAHQGIPVVGINYKDDNQKAEQWLDKLGDPYQFNIADNTGTLGFDLGVYGAPETYLIDEKGVIRYRHVGVLTREIWEDTLYPLYQKLFQESQNAD